MAFLDSQPLERLYVSTVTLAEFRFGIERVIEPTKRSELSGWLQNMVRPMFEQRVLPVSEDVLVKWRLLIDDGRCVGHTYSHPDLLIAATALQFGLTVVSRDESEFSMAHTPCLNPWKA